MTGIHQPDEGEILLDGKPIRIGSSADAQLHGIAAIYQEPMIFPDLNVAENIFISHQGRGAVMQWGKMYHEADAVLAKLGVALDVRSPARGLTVAAQQTVEIAKALSLNTRVLIMDEPTAALNQTEVNALFNNIAVLKEQGVTILYVSHRLDEIFQLADWVTVLRDGEHISTNPISEVTRASLVEDMIGRKLTNIFPERVDKRGDEVLRVEGLTVEGTLDRVSFGLRRGEVLAVAGLSGSGKTELGKALYGDLPIDGGAIMLNGKPLKASPTAAIRNGMSYLPEDRKAHGVFQEHTVKRNISISVLQRLANRLGILNLSQEREVAEAQVKALDIKTPSLDQLVMNLSGGNQQKVALARCLAVSPDVFLLMEPTQGIDVGVKFELYQFIAEQAASGRAILLISSELAEILGLSHRILVMREGRIVADLDTAQTNQEEILRYALGEATTAAESDRAMV